MSRSARRAVAGALAAAFCLVMAPATAGAATPHADDEWYLPVPGGCRLYVHELGQGPDTIVVLHGGFGAEHGYLLPAVEALATGHHLVLYDQRGSLRSPCADSLVTFAAHVDDLHLLQRTLHARRMPILAHSMGTRLALAYLARYPREVGTLVLAGLVPPRSPRDAGDSAVLHQSDSLYAVFRHRPAITAVLHAEQLDGPDSALDARARTHRWRVQFAGSNASHVERWRSMRGGQVFFNAAAGRAASRTAPAVYDYVPAIAAHPCAVWVINGEFDLSDMTGNVNRRWAAEAPRVHLVMVRDAAHNIWIDQPKRWRALVAQAFAPTTEAAHCRAIP